MTIRLPISPDAQRAKLTARDFWLLADAGAFEGYTKTELLDGELWVVNTVHRWHSRVTALVTTELSIALRQMRAELLVFTSGSVDLSDDSVPEPDVSVCADLDGKALQLAAVHLAVELTDTTRGNDLKRKPRLYAEAGIPEYWVFNREAQHVVRMWSPTPGGYAQRDEVPFGQPVGSNTIAGLAMPTDELQSLG